VLTCGLQFRYPSDAVARRKASHGLSGAHSQAMVLHPTTSCSCMFGCALLRLSTLDNIKSSFGPEFRWEKSRAAVVMEVIGLRCVGQYRGHRVPSGAETHRVHCGALASRWG